MGIRRDSIGRARGRDESRWAKLLEFMISEWLINSTRRRLVVFLGLCLLASSGIIACVTPKHAFTLWNCNACLASFSFLLFALALLGWILQHPEGSEEQIAISRAVQEGAEGFYSTINSTIAKLSAATSVFLFLCYALRSSDSFPEELRKGVSPVGYGAFVAVTFLLGAGCSALAGHSGVWVSVRANSRVACAATARNYPDALQLCFRGGAFSSIINVTLAVGSLAFLMALSRLIFPAVPTASVPLLLVGFGFGASFVALFSQLGGGIFTKAADVGADLVGKVEAGIPEDDARNPAVIADLVGDNVGDCAGQCADLFESMAAEMLAAMILGSALLSQSNDELSTEMNLGFVLFPLAVHIMDLCLSTFAILAVGAREREAEQRRVNPAVNSAGNTNNIGLTSFTDLGVIPQEINPLKSMISIYVVLCLVGAIGFTILCKLLLDVGHVAPNAWLKFASCGFAGIVAAAVFLFATQYYTDYNFSRVQHIAESSLSGAATNIIAGMAVGMESTAIPVLAISAAIVFAYHQGSTSGLSPVLAGLFGTAVATMGMLSTAVYVLSMSSFGPIADNAGGIVEMAAGEDAGSGDVEAGGGLRDSVVRDITDRLDAVGNVTKANTKGFSVGSAALASFLLFSAFLDEVSVFAKEEFRIVDITSPDVFVGGLLGGCSVLVFSSLALAAVGNTAGEVVNEVRRQLKEKPSIMTFQDRPDYKKCVSIVSQAALRQMIAPGLIAVLSPVVVGVLFKLLGRLRGNHLLGVEALGAFMMFSTSTGVLMALFLNNSGGAWDNAKKYIETGKHGGKGSAAHKAAVVGDTVGDPCKDTAGPSVHVLIKLVATVTLVLTPLFVSAKAAA